MALHLPAQSWIAPGSWLKELHHSPKLNHRQNLSILKRGIKLQARDPRTYIQKTAESVLGERMGGHARWPMWTADPGAQRPTTALSAQRKRPRATAPTQV
jgi:hypothetical protein